MVRKEREEGWRRGVGNILLSYSALSSRHFQALQSSESFRMSKKQDAPIQEQHFQDISVMGLQEIGADADPIAGSLKDPSFIDYT